MAAVEVETSTQNSDVSMLNGVPVGLTEGLDVWGRHRKETGWLGDWVDDVT